MFVFSRNRVWSVWLGIGINVLMLGVMLCSCGCSEDGRDESQASNATAEDDLTSAKTVDFEGYPFGPGWVLGIAENDRKWAVHLVDRVITAYATGQVDAEILYLNEIMRSLNVVQIEGSFEDYREPLFITTDCQTALARRLSDAGLDIRPARHTPWNYKDGFIRGVTSVLEYAVNKPE